MSQWLHYFLDMKNIMRCSKFNKRRPNLSELEMSVFLEGYKCQLNEIRKTLIKLLEIEKRNKKRINTCSFDKRIIRSKSN